MGISDEAKVKIDKIIAEVVTSDSPGLAMAVKYQGEVYSKGFGLANLQTKDRITPQTVFHVGSVAKQFTAMCVSLLCQDKKWLFFPRLKLSDKVRKYVLDLPKSFDDITIRQLLTHGSGLREMLVLIALKGSRWGIDEISRDDILDLIRRMKSRQFDDPGSDFAYSNTNFFLAGEIVKAVANVPLSEYAQKNIFDPLKMTNTRIIDDYNEPVDRAQGYQPIAGGFKKAAPPYRFSGPTNLLTTVEDLMKWDGYFDTQEPGGKEAIWRLLSERKAKKMGIGKYGLGLYVRADTNDMPVDVWHNGLTVGHRAMLYRGYASYPQNEVTVAILTNFEFFKLRGDDREIDELVSKLLDAVVEVNGWLVRDATSPEPPNKFEPDSLDDVVGQYRSEEIDSEYEIKFDGDALTITRPKRGAMQLMPMGKDEFWVDGFDEYLPILKRVKIELGRDGEDRVSGFFLSSEINPGRFSNFPFKKTA